MKAIEKIFLAALAALTVSAALGVSAETEARKKARYYYSAGIQEQAQEHEDAAYEYFKKAYSIDPTYAEAASAYGTRRLYVGLDTLQSDTELDRSLSMMRAYVDAYPEDLYESQYYGYAAGQLDNLDEAIRVLERTYSHHPSTSNILLQISDAYARANDLPKAVEAIDRYERQEGLTPQITTRKLSYLLAEADTAGAVREVDRLVRTNPGDPMFNILKGNVYDVINQPDSAMACYLLAESLDPESGAAKLALASCYLQAGDSVAYDNKIYEVLLSEDLDLDQKTDLLGSYLQSLITDKHETARGDYLFSVLSNQYPHEPRVLDLAARYLAAKGEFKDAEEQISYAVDLDPTNITYWGQLMTYQSAGDNPERALETYDRAKKHITPDSQLKFYYASVAQFVKQYDKAATVYREMIEEIEPGLSTDTVHSLRDLRPDISLYQLDMLSKLFTSLGDVQNSADKIDDSYVSYENALVFDSSNHMAANNYAYFMSTKGGDLDKALELSSKAITGDDAENPTYLDTYAWIHYLKGDYAKAEEIQLRAIEAAEKNAYESYELYDHFGDIKARNGDILKADEAWNKALEIMKKHEETEEKDYRLIHDKISAAAPEVKAARLREESENKDAKKDDTSVPSAPTQKGNNEQQPTTEQE